ncbi:hypothetical protein Pfo_003377, partial [Paulownia fortunei]
QGRGDHIGVDRERDDHVAEVGRRGGRSRSSPPSRGGGLKSTSRVSDVVLGISAPEASTEPAPKRARDFGTTSAPRGAGKGFFTCGLNQSEGVESYWDTQDTGVGWRKTRSIVNDFDIGRFSGKPSRSISEALADDLARVRFYSPHCYYYYFYAMLMFCPSYY